MRGGSRPGGGDGETALARHAVPSDRRQIAERLSEKLGIDQGVSAGRARVDDQGNPVAEGLASETTRSASAQRPAITVTRLLRSWATPLASREISSSVGVE